MAIHNTQKIRRIKLINSYHSKNEKKTQQPVPSGDRNASKKNIPVKQQYTTKELRASYLPHLRFDLAISTSGQIPTPMRFQAARDKGIIMLLRLPFGRPHPGRHPGEAKAFAEPELPIFQTSGFVIRENY